MRRILTRRTDVVEKRMFGGLCFMVHGRMCCGLTETAFMVRVGKERYREALALPHARPMDFTGRPLAGMVYVDPPGYRTDAALAGWVQLIGVDIGTPEGARAALESGVFREKCPALVRCAAEILVELLDDLKTV